MSKRTGNDKQQQTTAVKTTGDGILCGADFYDLAEGCIAVVISFTSARDACRLATVSRIFKSAADSDPVWIRFLPADYEAILARCVEGGTMVVDSKKELYRQLVERPLIVDGGRKAFRLDKETGKKCYMIAARDLHIVWSDTPRYWEWSSLPESRFSEVAELISVCWFEIGLKMHTSLLLSAGTNYAVYLVFKMTEESYGFRTAEATVGTAGGKRNTIEVLLEPNHGPLERLRLVHRRGRLGRFGLVPSRPAEGGDEKWPKQRSDGWLEQKLGEFSSNEEDDGEVKVSLLETKANWKGGLIVEGIEFRPVVASSPGS
ncbi:putative F-box protein PP2-B2 [Drosera capensis]